MTGEETRRWYSAMKTLTPDADPSMREPSPRVGSASRDASVPARIPLAERDALRIENARLKVLLKEHELAAVRADERTLHEELCRAYTIDASYIYDANEKVFARPASP